MSDKYNSPMEDIFDICQEQRVNNAFLLLGHKGCGKSTELNRLSAKFHENGYMVKTIGCSLDLDLVNIVYSDILILMGEALLKIAEECGCKISKNTLNDIENFWDEGTKTITSQELEKASLETGVSVESPGILTRILNVFTKIKADLKYNEETRLEYRKKISVRSSEWVKLLRDVSDEIKEGSGGKAPIIIFEDLDKLDPVKVIVIWRTCIMSLYRRGQYDCKGKFHFR